MTTPVLDNDTLDGLPPAVDAVDVTVLVQPANGTVVVGDDGTVTYTPDPGFSGEDVYQYQVCETLNPGNCASATVTVTVLPNRVEAIDDTPGSVGPGEPLDVVVVGNDTSTGAPLDPHSVRVSTPPANGQATCTAGTCTYTPRPGFVGIDTFVYEVCDTSWPVVVCDTATVTIDVEGAATLRLTKTAGVREVRVGDLVRYTLTVENVGEADVTGASLLDTPPAGFSYVGGSLVAEDGRAYATSGYNPIRIDGLSLAVGERTTLHYLLRVGAGVRSGTHVNQVEAFDAAGTSLSNVATAQVRSAVDPLLDESLVVGTVFHDRDGDGWQDSAALSGVHVRGGFAPGAYVAGSTTLDRGDGHQPVADASAPLLHGIALGRIAGRGSEADRSGGNRVVIRQRLREPAFTDDFVLTSSQGITLRMAADGTTTVETSGEAARGLTAAEPVVERRVSAVADGYVVDYVIDNRGIDERGIPGVRIATVEGLLVETDQYGRYHLTGLSGGVRANGRNLILKVDPSTLPPGTVFTTDNPQLRRVTPGLPVRFDFGVQMPATALEGGTERIELELGEVLFAPGSAVLEPRYLPVVEAMAARIDAHAGGDVLIRADGESEALAFERAAALRDALRAAVDPAHADALTVALRAETDDPQTLVALLGEGGTLLGTVLFETDSAEIHPEFGPLLDRLAAFLERRGGGTVTIAGHTDVRGSHAYNAALGLRRAQAVFAALEQRLSPGLRAAVRVEASAGPAAAIGTTREQGERAP
ncbi:Ig-like domain-containing protein [Coralloluteibacterium thermophilus]|uniref:Ig-like domain-containing protein n=1 Tax=Coralloluteibacterium thermophilum TaxID=2707049 RepID=A0ABV9NQB8_9GAMM